MSNTKIQIRMGNLEIQFEGTEEFFKTELLSFLKELQEIKPSGTLKVATQDLSDSKEPAKEINKNNEIKLSTNTIASRLKVKSGPDLIIAACANLSIVQGMEKYTGNEIQSEMKTATGFIKKSMVSNFRQYLKALVKNQKINEVSTDTYSLTEQKISEIRNKIAD